MAYEIGLGNPVSALQKMLRDLGKVYDFIPPLGIDGIFGEKTLEAVLLYQKNIFPPVTGVVNQEVWDSIRAEVEQVEGKLQKPRVLRAFPEGVDSLDFGEERSEIALFQTMFALLAEENEEISPDPPSGIFTESLRKNVIWLQEIASLPTTGQLDRETWDRLARLYEILITAE